MDNKKFIIISLKNTKDFNISKRLIEDADSIKSWVIKSVKNPCAFLSSPTLECIKYAQILSQSFSSTIKILPDLALNPDCTYFTSSIDDISYEPLTLPNVRSSNDWEGIMNFLQDQEINGVLIVEEEILIKNPCKAAGRKRSESTYYEIKMQASSAEAVKEMVVKEFKSSFYGKFDDMFEHKSKDISQDFKGIKENIYKLPQEVGSMVKNIKNSYWQEQKELCDELTSMNNVVNTLEEQVTAIQSKITDYEELSNLYIITEVPKTQIEIKKFYNIKSSNKFKLKIQNHNEDTFKKVEIFLSEQNKKIAEIQIIQPYSIVTKYVEVDIGDYFYKHIIAVMANNVVSNPFTIYPYHLSFVKHTLFAGKKEVKVISYVEKDTPKIIVVSTNSDDDAKNIKNLKYLRSVSWKLKKDWLGNEIFVIDGQRKASNALRT
ncbi:hypothetical protein SteCoe_35466 [Stentor coeruleus]|uniref:Uncharacterized protein n=1 Tax=Stentor coeruleus TaxID=5963 RepID=A0A1R2AS98_9CILI|nr:hypothetical protein SteCoe_35466 [Stentor coeruleus]